MQTYWLKCSLGLFSSKYHCLGRMIKTSLQLFISNIKKIEGEIDPQLCGPMKGMIQEKDAGVLKIELAIRSHLFDKLFSS